MPGVPSRLNYLIFAAASLAYIVAVTQRTSLGAAGITAAEQFSANSTQLAALGVMQIVVYAGLQIPVGMLLDRFGPTRLISVGAALMVIGQTTVALSPDLTWAIGGRMLVGAGDATTYVSGLRLLSTWFEPRRVPVMTQWYAAIGQLGQIFSVVPFAAFLGLVGWTPAFLSLAGLGVVSFVAVIITLRDSQTKKFESHNVSARGALAKLRDAFSHPGTRLGFWTHFTTQFSMVTFSLLWGFPLMVQGLGYTPETASMLLALIVVAGMVGGPILGILTARFPFRRSNLVLGVCGTTLGTWLVFLLWPGEPPFWYVLILIIVLGAGGVGSNIGFDFARTSNPVERFGSASGIVNVGGFLASVIAMSVIGVVLDAVGPGPDGIPTLAGYKAAFTVFPVLLVVGMSIITVLRHKVRRRLEADEGIVIGPMWVAIARRWRRRSEGA